LRFSVFRILEFRYTRFSLLGFEFCIWYWHFVDVVWLFLFFVLYL
jgi:cytochrome c oxidase subunit 3